MSGYHTILFVERLKARADKLGFELCRPKHSSFLEGDTVALTPKDINALPIYARDAQLFEGTLEELKRFFDGIEWAREYDEYINLSNQKKREQKEQVILNKQLVQRLKDEQIEVLNESNC